LHTLGAILCIGAIPISFHLAAAAAARLRKPPALPPRMTAAARSPRDALRFAPRPSPEFSRAVDAAIAEGWISEAIGILDVREACRPREGHTA
jgi:hypothetical protein